MVVVRGVLPVSLFVACLLLAAPGCKKKDDGKEEGANVSKLILGKWQQDKVTLEFAADKVTFKSTREGASGSGQGIYKVLDDKTLEMPKLGAGFEEKVTIDSISTDKLVLSGGGTWKFDKTAFTRPTAAAAPASNKEKIVAAWEVVKSSDDSWKPGNRMEFIKDGTMKGIGKRGNESVTFGYQYVIDGDRLKTTRMTDGAPANFTIKTLTDNQLVLVDVGNHQTIELKKKGSGSPASNKDRIIGTWEAAKSKDFPFEVSLEFARDGKMKMTVKAQQPITKEGTYDVVGDKIQTTRNEGGKELKDVWTIQTLDDNQLIYLDGRGKLNQFKKKTGG